MAEHTHTFTSDNFQEDVIDSNIPVLVDFWATWCPPCKMLAPIIDELSSEYEDQVKIGKVDVDKDIELAAKYEITSVPTLILFKQGEEKERILGVESKSQLKQVLDNA